MLYAAKLTLKQSLFWNVPQALQMTTSSSKSAQCGPCQARPCLPWPGSWSNACYPAVPSRPNLPTSSLCALWFICSPHPDVCVTGYANIPNNMLIGINKYSSTFRTTFRMTAGSLGSVSLGELSSLQTSFHDSPGDTWPRPASRWHVSS